MSFLGKLDFWCSGIATWWIGFFGMGPEELWIKMPGMVNHCSNDQITGAAGLNQMAYCPILREE